METEKLLPADNRLDYYFDKYLQDIYEDTETLMRQQDGYLLSSDLEFHSYGLLQTFSSTAHTLEKDVIRTGDIRSYQVMYRSIIFAAQVARRIHEDYMYFDAG